jgi:prepilin-type N-terminal cleavage/methylation domain-containing protein
MLRRNEATVRGGFTLLEVVLATAIGVILLAALYVSFELYLSHIDRGRRQVEQGTLVRSIFDRMDADLGGCLNLSDPSRYRMQQNQANSANSANNANAATPTTTPATTTPGGTSTNGGQTTGTGGITTNSVVLSLSVQGDSQTLFIYVSRTPRELYPSDPNATVPPVSDLRRICYYYYDGGDGKRGLARQEIKTATADDAWPGPAGSPTGMPTPPNDLDDGYTKLMAEEVRSVAFRYYGDPGTGLDWQTEWDCTTLGADGVTPIGPPRAVEITLEIALPRGAFDDGEERTKTFRHVVNIMASDGQPLSSTTTGGGSTP